MAIQTICGNTACLELGHQLIGLYRLDDRRCILLDCGAAALREPLEQALRDEGLTPAGILATHTHYDHFANAAYFQRKYGIPVSLSFGEAELCRTHPAVKGHLFVYSAGEILSDPELRDLPCKVDRVIYPGEDEIVFCGIPFGVLPTPGHSPEHTAFLTPDGVCYAGDALLCEPVLTASKLPYAYNLRQYLESVEVFRHLSCQTLLLAHRGVIEAPFDSILDENRRVFEQAIDGVAAIIDRRMSVEEIYTAVRETMHIRVDTPRKAENLERFLRPYLECLLDDGILKLSLRGSGTLCYEPA